MGERYLYQKCPFLKEVSQERREQFETYFRTAPDWLIDAFVVEKMKKGTTFIRENNPADTIYFIIEGLIMATDTGYLGSAMILCSFEKCMRLAEWNLLWIWMSIRPHFER